MSHNKEETNVKDKGGTRSGQERRKKSRSYKGIERRSGRDRRKGFDRRTGLARRRTPDRRNKASQWNVSRIERRDVFRNS